MSDKKISQLTASTVPLAGTEVLPIVQGGDTKKVSVADLTAGRTVDAAIGNFTKATAGDAVTWTNGGASAKKGFLYSDNQYIALLDIGGAGNGTGILIDSSNANLYLNTVGGTKLSLFSSSGNVTVNTGNLVIGTAGKGVNFTANTPAAGMTSQLLNWYEEGTWTPSVTSLGGSLTSYTSVGRYTKIGNSVSIFCSISITDVGTGFLGLKISNLPFTSYNIGSPALTVGTGVFRDMVNGGIGAIQVNKNSTEANMVYALATGYVFDFTVTYQSA